MCKRVSGVDRWREAGGPCNWRGCFFPFACMRTAQRSHSRTRSCLAARDVRVANPRHRPTNMFQVVADARRHAGDRLPTALPPIAAPGAPRHLTAVTTTHCHVEQRRTECHSSLAATCALPYSQGTLNQAAAAAAAHGAGGLLAWPRGGIQSHHGASKAGMLFQLGKLVFCPRRLLALHEQRERWPTQQPRCACRQQAGKDQAHTCQGRKHNASQGRRSHEAAHSCRRSTRATSRRRRCRCHKGAQWRCRCRRCSCCEQPPQACREEEARVPNQDGSQAHSQQPQGGVEGRPRCRAKGKQGM